MSTTEKIRQHQEQEVEREGKFLTFFLAEEEYGLEILKVQEIIGLMPITRVPRTPRYVKGVVNLRGKVIPVVDLRLKFGMEAVETTDLTCIIVVQTRDVLFGVLVDRVSEVVDLATSDVEETPDFGVDVDTGYIMGMGNAGDRVTILLDIDRVLADDELEALRAAERDAA